MGHVVITDDDGEQIRRDMSKVIVIGMNMDTPRELLAMGETHRVLSAIPADEAARVAAWLVAKFPQPPF